MGGIGPPRATGEIEVTWIEVQIAKARADALEEAAAITNNFVVREGGRQRRANSVGLRADYNSATTRLEIACEIENAIRTAKDKP